ncbi:hypothetical protein HPB51_022232 [Rhipicephalus microplus]|uniref:CCHC-type domain-containing protein n=1 Tax=Rhipicephalus microplus TaxID=6941 RepID=A0A9J6E4T6_RHIMP|nr:hypothetical protein HPB51_022232 [Rhipicephalus microplus]
MAEQSPPFSATPLERPSRSLVPTSSHRRSASVACTRVLWNLISSAKAVRLHHEQAQKLCRVVSEKPTSLRLPVLAADVETTARGLTSSAASSPTTSTTASSTAVAAHHTAQLEDAGSILCVNVTVPQNVPLPLDEEPDIADMDTTSTRKRSRPSESGSDDEGGSRKMHAVAPERATGASPSMPSSSDEADSDTERADPPSRTTSLKSRNSHIASPGSERPESEEDFPESDNEPVTSSGGRLGSSAGSAMEAPAAAPEAQEQRNSADPSQKFPAREPHAPADEDSPLQDGIASLSDADDSSLFDKDEEEAFSSDHASQQGFPGDFLTLDDDMPPLPPIAPNWNIQLDPLTIFDWDATDEISQSEFQTVLSKSKKRRQRASTSQGPAAHTGPRPATESTAMLAHVAPGTSNAPTATQTAPAGVRATEHTMPASASSSLDPGTILFRPANASASFHRTSRLAIAQALSALPGVKEVRVNTKKNIVAADASTPEWMNRLLATSELAGIPVTARLPADRSQSSGVVQGVDGDYTDEALLAAVSSDVPVIAARRQGTSLVLRFASPVPPTRVRLFRMVFEVRPSRPRPLQCRRCGRYGHIAVTCRGPERCLRCGGHHGKDANCTNKLRCLHCGRPHSADSADCQLWQRERRLATIKASAPTYLPHREAQAVLRASPSVTDSPQLKQTTGKSYAAAVGSPSKMTVSSTHPGQTGVQQRGPSAGLKHPDSTTTRPPAKVPSQPRVDQENANLRLLLRAVADLLPPENQLRSICLQAGGAHPHSSHHG